jgi:F-type H+-transporting ATPase subunit epsilon
MPVLTVSVVTPAGVIYDHHASFLVVRTGDGELGFLPEHEALIAPFIIGEVKVRRTDLEEHIDFIAVNGGIVEVRENLVTIIADSAERERNIDINRAQRAKNRAERVIELAKESKNTDQLKRAEVALHRAINRINVSTKHQNL